METSFIRTALKVAETCNMSKAALDMFVEPFTVSQQVNRVERELGFLLFDRTGNRMNPLILTDQGVKWVAFARKAIDLLEAGAVEVKRAERAKLRKGRLPR